MIGKRAPRNPKFVARLSGPARVWLVDRPITYWPHQRQPVQAWSGISCARQILRSNAAQEQNWHGRRGERVYIQSIAENAGPAALLTTASPGPTSLAVSLFQAFQP